MSCCDRGRTFAPNGTPAACPLGSPRFYFCSAFDFSLATLIRLIAARRLLDDPQMVVRSSYAPFIARVRRWFAALLPRIRPLLFHNGGPVVMLQIENEFGNYAHDPDYMRRILSLVVAQRIDCLLFTADGAHADSQQAGGIDGVLRTLTLVRPIVRFIFLKRIQSSLPAQRKNPTRALTELRTVQPSGPALISEAWAGWFDAWGAAVHTVRTASDVAMLVDAMLSIDVSFNLYMFAGGTNGASRNGALIDDETNRFLPQTTSYDYSAAIAEVLQRSCALFKSIFVLMRFVSRRLAARRADREVLCDLRRYCASSSVARRSAAARG